VALPKTYLESSVIGYLTARPSRDIVATAHQQVTREWWEKRRHEFDLYVSSEVVNEIGRGDADAAQRRLSLIEGLPLLVADSRAQASLLRFCARLRCQERHQRTRHTLPSPRSMQWTFL